MKNKKIFEAEFIQEKYLYRNYNRFYVEGKQELCPFLMYIPYRNAICSGSSQVFESKNKFTFELRLN